MHQDDYTGWAGDTALEESRNNREEIRDLMYRISTLERQVDKLMRKKPKKSKAEKAEAKMWKRRRAEDVAADPGAAY